MSVLHDMYILGERGLKEVSNTKFNLKAIKAQAAIYMSGMHKLTNRVEVTRVVGKLGISAVTPEVAAK